MAGVRVATAALVAAEAEGGREEAPAVSREETRGDLIAPVQKVLAYWWSSFWLWWSW